MVFLAFSSVENGALNIAILSSEASYLKHKDTNASIVTFQRGVLKQTHTGKKHRTYFYNP